MAQNSLTPEDVAEALNIKKNTVYEMVKRGELTAYRIGRKIRIDEGTIENFKGKKQRAAPLTASAAAINAINSSFVICGQDTILDILARHMEKRNPGIMILRSYRDGYNALYDLYNDKVSAAAAHLWDGDTDTYNECYMRGMMPGVPVKRFPLAKRSVGFYVKTGNPKKLRSWEDFRQDGLTFINREPGSGIRVLVDEHLRLMRIDPNSVNGYDLTADSHVLAAGAVARGFADFAVGNEKTARQADGVEFVFLQREDYELVIKERNLDAPLVQSLLQIVASESYKSEILLLGGYDTSGK